MADLVGQQLGNYRLIRLLGRDGFDTMYLAENLRLRTQAAVRVLQSSYLEESANPPYSEIRTIAGLRHPNIVRIVDFDLEWNPPYVVEDYAPNGTLRQRYPRGTRLPLDTVITYLNQIASALDYIHALGIIHRDVKPENMLIDRNGEILLGDFTVAVASAKFGSENIDIIGTPAYMAPDQIQGRLDPASDQYSLGVVVYEWLSGTPPFNFNSSFTELAYQHVSARPPSLREKVPTISPEVEQVVMTTLAKDPRQRFPSVGAFASALEQAARHSGWERGWMSAPGRRPEHPSGRPQKVGQGVPEQQQPPTQTQEWEPASAQPAVPDSYVNKPQEELIFQAPPSSTPEIESMPTVTVPASTTPEMTYHTRDDDNLTAAPGDEYGTRSMNGGSEIQVAPPHESAVATPPPLPPLVPAPAPDASEESWVAPPPANMLTASPPVEKTELSLFAITNVALEEGDVAFVGKMYALQAVIARNSPDDFRGEPFELVVESVTEPITFDILLHESENIELLTSWHRRLRYRPDDAEPQLVTFRFQLVAAEESSLVIDFYHERRWLRTIRLEFDAVEQSQFAPVSSEV